MRKSSGSSSEFLIVENINDQELIKGEYHEWYLIVTSTSGQGDYV